MPPFTGEDRLVIAIDFGTTFSGVAFASSGDKEQFEVINTWPNSGSNARDKVPTEILYLDAVPGAVHSGADAQRRFKWGYSANTESQKNTEPLKWFKLLLHDQNIFAHDGLYGKGITGLASQNPRGPELMWAGGLWSMFSDLVLSPYSWMFPKAASPASLHEQARLTADLEKRVTEETPVARTAAQIARLQLHPVNVVTDYLRSLNEYVMSVIKKRFGSDFISKKKTEYVITIPAVWSDSAKALTVQAAKNVGFGEYEIDFNLVGEPEAAAAYSLQAVATQGLKERDTFVVCDAGGGTVDLVSYKIELLNPLAISEIVGGSGGLCGSVSINKLFEEHIRKRLGGATIDDMKPVVKCEVMRQWEEKVKFNFADAEDIESYRVYIPGVASNEKNRVEDGFLSLTREEVKSIFDPVINSIIDLVSEQIANVKIKGRDISAVVLVGGFGSSEYLYKRLSEHIFFGRKVQVIQPLNPWTSIIRGALIRGLDGSFVKDRVARRHYGIGILVPYQEGKGLEKFKVWCDDRKRWLASSQMEWIVDKGMIIEDQKTFSIPVFRILGAKDSNQKITVELLTCSSDEPPSWRDPERVFPACELAIDLSLLREKFRECTNLKGEKYWKVEFSFEMKVSNGMLTFWLKCDGKNYGTVEAKFY